MFSFLQSKKNLISVLQGSIDIHNHLLAGIDDGAETLADTLALISAYDRNKISHIIATPHIMSGSYPNTPNSINSALKETQKLLAENGLNHIKITAAAEYMIDDTFEHLIDQGTSLLTLKDKYILVELSYYSPPINLHEILYKLTINGYIPILAHPERYTFFHQDHESYIKLKKLGCLFQVNLLSLTPYYGSEIMKTAQLLLKNGFIDFVASDIHNKNQLKTMEDCTISRSTYSLLRQCSLKAKELFVT